MNAGQIITLPETMGERSMGPKGHWRLSGESVAAIGDVGDRPSRANNAHRAALAAEVDCRPSLEHTQMLGDNILGGARL